MSELFLDRNIPTTYHRFLSDSRDSTLFKDTKDDIKIILNLHQTIWCQDSRVCIS